VPEGYRVYQRTEGRSLCYTQPVWTGPTTTTGTVYNLDHDITYYFVVRAITETMKAPIPTRFPFCPLVYADRIYLSASTTGNTGPFRLVRHGTVCEGSDQAFAVLPERRKLHC
jgi:hypothetical protein